MDARPPAIFVADAPALDFLNSIASPAGAPVEWIVDGEGLVAWLRQAELVPGPVLREMAGHAGLEEVATQARELREWFRRFVASHMGKPLDAGAVRQLAPLNRLLERDERHERLAVDPSTGQLALTKVRRWSTPESLLFPVAEAMARFVASEDFRDIKTCEGAHCTLLFADHTRARARRWCSMSACGNRAKVAAHRSRKKATG